jgi:hypothetical protein
MIWVIYVRFTPKADMCGATRDVRYGPIALRLRGLVICYLAPLFVPSEPVVVPSRLPV